MKIAMLPISFIGQATIRVIKHSIPMSVSLLICLPDEFRSIFIIGDMISKWVDAKFRITFVNIVRIVHLVWSVLLVSTVVLWSIWNRVLPNWGNWITCRWILWIDWIVVSLIQVFAITKRQYLFDTLLNWWVLISLLYFSFAKSLFRLPLFLHLLILWNLCVRILPFSLIWLVIRVIIRLIHSWLFARSLSDCTVQSTFARVSLRSLKVTFRSVVFRKSFFCWTVPQNRLWTSIVRGNVRVFKFLSIQTIFKGFSIIHIRAIWFINPIDYWYLLRTGIRWVWFFVIAFLVSKLRWTYFS